MTPGEHKQKLYERRRRAWSKRIGFPWPSRA